MIPMRIPIRSTFQMYETDFFTFIRTNKKFVENIRIHALLKLKLDFEIGQNFYNRIKKVVDLGLMTDEEIKLRRKNYELAKSSGVSKEFVLKGPT